MLLLFDEFLFNWQFLVQPAHQPIDGGLAGAHQVVVSILVPVETLRKTNGSTI